MTHAPWSGGYVADIAYIEGYYPQQSPSRLVFAALLGSVAAELAQPDDPAHYLEIGCGKGMNALLTAAANPRWQVTAIDYSPAHLAFAADLARRAQVENIRFVEADLATLAGEAEAASIPPADYVSMHGFWSWVGPKVQAGAVRLLAAKTRPGALVHVSYNALPAWQGALAMQRIIYEGGRRLSGRSDRQAEAGLALAREIAATGGRYLTEGTVVDVLLGRSNDLPPEYISHEYMNAYWAPTFQADVAAALAEAKLDWAASANPIENFPELMLKPDQRQLMERYDDPLMRELIKDSCLPRYLRHDVYVRGARRLTNKQRDEAIGALSLYPLVLPDELDTEIHVPAGVAEVSETLREMMRASLRGPSRVADQLALYPGSSSPAELAGVLVATGQSAIMAGPVADQPAAATRLNRALGDRVASVATAPVSGGLAAARLGCGYVAPRLLQFIAGRLLAGETEADAGRWLETLSSDLSASQREELAGLIDRAVSHRLPLMRGLGIVPP